MTRPHDRNPAPSIVLAVVILAGLSFALLQTMVAPALHALQEDLDTDQTGVAWILTGFLLSASVATPIIGKLGDLYGKNRVLVVVLLLFSAGSVLCAFAPSLELVVAGRVVQGVAGGVFPLAFGIIRDSLPPERVAIGLGMMSAAFGIGGGIALPLAGVIVDNLDVEFIFLTGLVALPAALAAWRVLPDSPRRPGAKIDWPGAALLSGALVALLFGLSRASAWGWGSGRVIGLVGAGLVLLVVWVFFERGRAEPLVDMRVFGSRPVAATNLTGMMMGFAMFSSFLLVPQLLQTPESTGYGFGTSVTTAGLVMLPSTFAMLVGGPLAGWLVPKIGGRAVLVIGTLFSVACFGMLALAHAEIWEIMVANVLLGVGIAFSFAAMANLVVQSVDPGDVGIATGMNTIVRTIGGALGAQLAATLLAAAVEPGSLLPTESGYTAAFAVATVGAIVATLAAVWIPSPPAGQQASGAGEDAEIGPGTAAPGEPAFAGSSTTR